MVFSFNLSPVFIWAVCFASQYLVMFKVHRNFLVRLRRPLLAGTKPLRRGCFPHPAQPAMAPSLFPTFEVLFSFREYFKGSSHPYPSHCAKSPHPTYSVSLSLLMPILLLNCISIFLCFFFFFLQGSLQALLLAWLQDSCLVNHSVSRACKKAENSTRS